MGLSGQGNGLCAHLGVLALAAVRGSRRSRSFPRRGEGRGGGLAHTRARRSLSRNRYSIPRPRAFRARLYLDLKYIYISCADMRTRATRTCARLRKIQPPARGRCGIFFRALSRRGRGPGRPRSRRNVGGEPRPGERRRRTPARRASPQQGAPGSVPGLACRVAR